jgi:PEGA domain-containing protein
MAARVALVLRASSVTIAATIPVAETAGAQPENVTAESEARSHLVLARRAAAAAIWTTALTEFTRSSELEPSAAAAEGIARSYDALHDDAAAYRAFRGLLDDYPKDLSRSVRSYVAARLGILAAATAMVTVRVNQAQARVVLDGADLGDTPLADPVRVNAGLHRVRVSKRGFKDVEQVIHAVAGTNDTISVLLVEASSPAEGERTGLGPVETVRPVAPVESSAVAVVTFDRSATIAIDGRVVGEGDFRGPISVGLHVVRVTRPGYEPFEKTVVVRAGVPVEQRVKLIPIAVIRAATDAGPDRHGVYGGFIAHLTLEPGGEDGAVCSVPGTTRCSTSPPLGGGLIGYLGYLVGPVGLDALFGIQADASTVNASIQGQTASVLVPRVGGIVALRARLEWQAGVSRLVMAAGFGAAFREVGLVASGFESAPYWAPAVTVQGAANFRIGHTTALSLGLLFWAENAGDGVSLQLKPLPTSAPVIRSTQAFFLPFVGLEFGP